MKSNKFFFFPLTGIFKSSCRIDMRWFPFDVQKCELKFGSWTYNGWSLKLTMMEAEINEHVPNGEWDLVGEARHFQLCAERNSAKNRKQKRCWFQLCVVVSPRGTGGFAHFGVLLLPGAVS